MAEVITDIEMVDALTSKDVNMASMARLVAAGLGECIGGWVEAECERGTDNSTILYVLALTLVQTYGSAVAQLTGEGGFVHAQNLFSQLVTETAEYARQAIADPRMPS